MDKQAFIEALDKIFEENLPFVLTDEQKEQMFLLSDALYETNKIMNLTAITDEKGMILRHIVDSLLISGHISAGSTVVDIGCGAGFPTLPLAVLRPDLQICAIDSTEKKIDFVKSTAELLGLENVHTVCGRAEELAHLPKYREKFDFATARAVAALPVLCELTLPFVKLGGSLVAMKAKDAAKELSESEKAIETLCGEEALKNLVLFKAALHNGSTSESRTMIKITKFRLTPVCYPRRFSQIKRSHL